MQVSFLQILTLLSVILYGVSSTAPVICSDICNTTSSAYSCATFTGVFNQVNPGTTVWFNANIANPASVTQTGFAFTNQRITIGSFVWNPPNAFITIDSSSTASTSFTGGRWVTTAGSSCGNVFLSGFQVDPSSQIATTTTFEWCGLFQSQTTFTTNPSWQFGAAAYNTSSFTTDYSALGVKPSNNCPTSIGPAGRPNNYLSALVVGATANTEGGDFVGSRSSPASFSVCTCPVTNAPTLSPTQAPTNAPTRSPTNAPTRSPTNAPTAFPTNTPTRAPTVAPTTAPTTAPTGAPTTPVPTRAPTPPTAAPTARPTLAPTPRPTRAPTPPTVAPTRGPTNAPTPPTVAPTRAPTPPTNAPTTAPTNAPTPPTNAPTRNPTNAPTPPTNAPTRNPTNFPTVNPTRAPTPFPTAAPTSPPVNFPTNAPTPPTNAPTPPPTVRPTRAPTPPTNAPPTNAPTTSAPTPPVDICTRRFTARFTLTYPSMTNAYVGGIMYYDWTANVLAFRYTNQRFQEIYQFNLVQGVGNINGQSVFRISPTAACSPCARYQNSWSFPVYWNTSGVDNPVFDRVDENGCSVYNTPPSNTNWAQSFGLYPNGTLCFIKNQDRLFQLDSFVFCASFDIDDTTPPDGCSCSTPQDIVFALDRSSSILTSSTYLYREFIQNFVDRYTFDPLSPSTSTQMGIVQYGDTLNPTTGLFPIGNYGSIPMTMVPTNIRTAVSQIGCVGNPCNFCNGNSNFTNCVFPTPYRTCTSCGLLGAGTLFTDTTNYRRRAISTKIIIVITDGNANLLSSGGLCCGDGNPLTGALVPGESPNCDDGLWQTLEPLGCFTDINNTKTAVQQMVPGVSIFAIGVGSLVNQDTLRVIASSDSNVLSAPDWQTFLTQLQSIITLTCVEPNPITSCGTGAGACGFCACGTTQLPDEIIPPNLCDEVRVVQASQCYTTVQIPLNCTRVPCKDTFCVRSMNNGTGGCIYEDTVCRRTDDCYEPRCIQGQCVARAVCNASDPSCNLLCAPPAPVDPTCNETTAGLGCGANGVCNSTTQLCDCINGYGGKICQFPPNISECVIDLDCDDTNACTIEVCRNDSGVGRCIYTERNCSDGNLCTLDFCNSAGCQNVAQVVCDDNNGCTDDACDPQTGTCSYTDRSPQCDYLTNICNFGYCDPKAPVDDQCYQVPVVCPIENNCTIAICYLDNNNTFKLTFSSMSGCTNQTLDCSFGFVGIIAGIAGGAIAGITIGAALLVAGATVGGSAYAISRHQSGEGDSNVRQNPLFRGATRGNDNPLGRPGK